MCTLPKQSYRQHSNKKYGITRNMSGKHEMGKRDSFLYKSASRFLHAR